MADQSASLQICTLLRLLDSRAPAADLVAWAWYWLVSTPAASSKVTTHLERVLAVTVESGLA